MSGAKLRGMKRLQKRLKDDATMDDVREAVAKTAKTLNCVMQKYSTKVFVKGYSKGNIRKSITTTIEDQGLTARVGTSAHYAPYVEYGTRFMSAEPFVRPTEAIAKRKLQAKLKKLMK